MPSKNSIGRIALHDMGVFTDPEANTDGLTLGEVDGIEYYADRAAVLNRRISYHLRDGSEDVLRGHHAHLRRLGLGPEQLRFVDGADIFQGILHDPVEIAHLKEEVAGGLTLEAFTGASRRWPQLLRTLGATRTSLRTTEWGIARLLDDKEELRLLSRKLGCEEYFPRHVFGQGPEEVRRLADQMLSEGGHIIVKRPDLESGVGTIRLLEEMVGFDQFLQDYAGGSRRMIIEEWVDGDEVAIASLQWYFSPGSQPEKRFISRQYCDGTCHAGNIIAHKDADCFPNSWPEELRRRIAEDAWHITQPFVDWAQAHGYVGNLGVDFITVVNRRNGHFEFRNFILEANARQTAGTYLEGARWQVEASGRLPTACAAMRNCHPISVKRWEDATEAFGDTRWSDGLGSIDMSPQSGIGLTIFNPRCLLLPRPKCIVLAFAATAVEAERLLVSGVNRLEGRVTLS